MGFAVSPTLSWLNVGLIGNHVTLVSACAPDLTSLSFQLSQDGDGDSFIALAPRMGRLIKLQLYLITEDDPASLIDEALEVIRVAPGVKILLIRGLTMPSQYELVKQLRRDQPLSRLETTCHTDLEPVPIYGPVYGPVAADGTIVNLDEDDDELVTHIGYSNFGAFVDELAMCAIQRHHRMAPSLDRQGARRHVLLPHGMAPRGQ